MEHPLAGHGARPKVEALWAAAYILLGPRFSSALAGRLYWGIVFIKEWSTYQALLEEGRNGGIALGQAQGLEGRAEGAVTEARKVLRLLGEEAFGPPDAPTIAFIDKLTDLARLEALLKHLRTAASWHELLAPALPRRRRT
jgi:hypothetical protein